MMKLGFVSAILPELGLEEVVSFAAKEGFACVELMCWPHAKAERRYAGITHVDVDALDAAGAAKIRSLMAEKKVEISGLGYYPNPLDPDAAKAAFYREHIMKVIGAAALLKVGVVNTFIGRDPAQGEEESFARFSAVWPDIIRFAEGKGVKVAIENCPMLFSRDEWPGGKNLASTPAIWRRMFSRIPSPNFGLNLDPSHLLWQRIDYVRPVREFKDRIFHVHIKDAAVDADALNEVGILATPLSYHTPKLPGLGDVEWGKFVSALTRIGYSGPACIEVEDRSFEDSLDSRKAALVLSRRYMSQFIPI